MSEHVGIGTVVGSFSLDGRIKVAPMTDFDERFDKGRTVFLKGQPYEIGSCTWYNGQARLKLVGVDKVEQADALRGNVMTVPIDERPELQEDVYYTPDLIGLRVFDQDGTEIGTVEEVLPFPAHDLFRVGNALIPATKSFVKEISMAERTMKVELIEGMRPGDEPEDAR